MISIKLVPPFFMGKPQSNEKTLWMTISKGPLLHSPPSLPDNRVRPDSCRGYGGGASVARKREGAWGWAVSILIFSTSPILPFSINYTHDGNTDERIF